MAESKEYKAKAKLYVIYNTPGKQFKDIGLEGKKNHFTVALQGGYNGDAVWLGQPASYSSVFDTAKGVVRALDRAVKFGVGESIYRTSNLAFIDAAIAETGERDVTELKYLVDSAAGIVRESCSINTKDMPAEHIKDLHNGYQHGIEDRVAPLLDEGRKNKGVILDNLAQIAYNGLKFDPTPVQLADVLSQFSHKRFLSSKNMGARLKRPFQQMELLMDYLAESNILHSCPSQGGYGISHQTKVARRKVPKRKKK